MTTALNSAEAAALRANQALKAVNEDTSNREKRLSSILVLRQKKSVHMMTDAAAYDGETGELRSVGLPKCIALPHLHFAVSCNGPALLGHYISKRMADEFTSFDDLIARRETELL